MALPLPLRLELRWVTWTLPRLVHRLPLTHLLADMTPSRPAPRWQRPSQEILDAVKAALARPIRMRGRRCLREGLAAFHFLRKGGHAAVLHFGVDRRSTRAAKLRGHCWISLEGQVVLNGPGPEFVELFAYRGQPLPRPDVARPAAAFGL
jgi:hypothetical protein